MNKVNHVLFVLFNVAISNSEMPPYSKLRTYFHLFDGNLFFVAGSLISYEPLFLDRSNFIALDVLLYYL